MDLQKAFIGYLAPVQEHKSTQISRRSEWSLKQICISTIVKKIHKFQSLKQLHRDLLDQVLVYLTADSRNLLDEKSIELFLHKNLRTFNLSYNPKTSLGIMKQVVEKCDPNHLTHFAFNSCRNLDDQSLEIILSSFPNIEYLDLSRAFKV